MEERGLTISRNNTEYLGTTSTKTQRSIYIHSAERMEELVDSVWSVVRQGNECEDQWEGVQDSGKTGTDVRGRDMGI